MYYGSRRFFILFLCTSQSFFNICSYYSLKWYRKSMYYNLTQVYLFGRETWALFYDKWYTLHIFFKKQTKKEDRKIPCESNFQTWSLMAQCPSDGYWIISATFWLKTITTDFRLIACCCDFSKSLAQFLLIAIGQAKQKLKHLELDIRKPLGTLNESCPKFSTILL